MFCPSCHSLLDLPDSDLVLRCLTCNYQVTFKGPPVQHTPIHPYAAAYVTPPPSSPSPPRAALH